jgi:Fe2+ transport system protein FeoA
MNPVTRLSELPVGAEAEVTGFDSKFTQIGRLREMGLLPGTRVKLIRWAPLGDPLEIKVRGYNLSLRRHEAEHVEVQMLTPKS